MVGSFEAAVSSFERKTISIIHSVFTGIQLEIPKFALYQRPILFGVNLEEFVAWLIPLQKT